MSKPMPKPREPKAPGPCIDTTPDKAIDAIRASAVVEPAAIPEPPATFRGAPIGTRNQFIEWVAEPDRAELSHAADELQENPAQLADDLGRRAPDVTTVSELQERVRTSGLSLARLEALIQATKQQHEVALGPGAASCDASPSGCSSTATTTPPSRAATPHHRLRLPAR
ncbi:MAG: hypothetical protein R3A52_26830 [Polyangiales bacterium]